MHKLQELLPDIPLTTLSTSIQQLEKASFIYKQKTGYLNEKIIFITPSLVSFITYLFITEFTCTEFTEDIKKIEN